MSRASDGESPSSLPAFLEASLNLHGTAIAVAGQAVLLRGRPGAGKSDLALRCIGLAPGPLVASQPMLIADDRVIVTRQSNVLNVTCPPPLLGLIEVRGVGIMAVPQELAEARLQLVVDLVASTPLERIPEPAEPAVICGIAVPRVLLAAFEASAPLKVVLALAAAVRASVG